MILTLIHGWAFPPSFWDALAPLLPYPQHRIDLGFFGPPEIDISTDEPNILIGHSLGFPYGIAARKNWTAWIAINSFPRFTIDNNIGCVLPTALHKMQKQLAQNPNRTLTDFHHRLGTTPPSAAPNTERLQHALEQLATLDITETLKTQTTPGLILASKNDPLVPTTATAALTTPRTQLHWHETGGHTLPQTAPAWCARHITDFIKQLAA